MVESRLFKALMLAIFRLETSRTKVEIIIVGMDICNIIVCRDSVCNPSGCKSSNKSYRLDAGCKLMFDTFVYRYDSALAGLVPPSAIRRTVAIRVQMQNSCCVMPAARGRQLPRT